MSISPSVLGIDRSGKWATVGESGGRTRGGLGMFGVKIQGDGGRGVHVVMNGRSVAI